MTDKYSDLIDFLKKRKPNYTTAKELAEYLNVTTRTIRNWVRNINEESNIIDSSNFGYLIKDDNNLEKSDHKYFTPDSAKERRAKIFVELLKQSNYGIDLYELAEKLFISDSTLRNDIQRLKEEMTTDSLQIEIRKKQIKLIGLEQDKRKYMVSLLYSETSLNDLLKAKMKEMLTIVSITELELDIRETLARKFNILLNQYVVRNIAIHLVVILERIEQGNVLKKQVMSMPEYLVNEVQMAKVIANVIENKYGITIPDTEISHLSMLFIGLPESHNNKLLSGIISKDFEGKMNMIIQKTQEIYLIDLSSVAFKKQLFIHVHNLLIRSKHNSFERNNHLLDIKIAYPIIYDVSVYLASLIQEEFHINIIEDEISYISLHIGALLDGQLLIDDDKIKLLIVADDYRGIKTNIYQKLKETLPGNVSIKTVSNYTDITDENFDVLISPDKKVALNYPGTVLVNPFLLVRDLTKVENRINKVKKSRQKNKIKIDVNLYFTKELYFGQIDFSNQSIEEIINFLSKKLINLGYVQENFTTQIIDREKMAPTDFPSGIAVPHTVNLNAIRTSITIATLQTPQIWNNHKVNIIALIAINKNDAKHFNNFFQNFIEVTSDRANVKLLSGSDSFDEFVTRLKLMLNEEII